MLGQLDVVKAFMAATPGLQKIRGPHSLSLMVHAKAGGPPAAAVVAYLESIGDAALPLTDEPLSADERAMLDGRYVFGDRPRDSFIVETKPNQVSIARAGATRAVHPAPRPARVRAAGRAGGPDPLRARGRSRSSR